MISTSLSSQLACNFHRHYGHPQTTTTNTPTITITVATTLPQKSPPPTSEDWTGLLTLPSIGFRAISSLAVGQAHPIPILQPNTTRALLEAT